MPARGAGAYEDQRTREAFGRELLGKHSAHRVAEQDRLRCDSFEKNLKLIEVVGHADPDESGALLVGLEPVADQVRRVASPAEFVEHCLKLIEAPAAFVRAVDHYDVLGHGVCTFPVRSRCCPPGNQRRNSKTKRRLKKIPAQERHHPSPLSSAARCDMAST